MGNRWHTAFPDRAHDALRRGRRPPAAGRVPDNWMCTAGAREGLSRPSVAVRNGVNAHMQPAAARFRSAGGYGHSRVLRQGKAYPIQKGRVPSGSPAGCCPPGGSGRLEEPFPKVPAAARTRMGTPPKPMLSNETAGQNQSWFCPAVLIPVYAHSKAGCWFSSAVSSRKRYTGARASKSCSSFGRSWSENSRGKSRLSASMLNSFRSSQSRRASG